MLRQSSRSRPSFRAIANAAGVLAIAAFAVPLFVAWTTMIFAPTTLGDFGATTNTVWRVDLSEAFTAPAAGR